MTASQELVKLIDAVAVDRLESSQQALADGVVGTIEGRYAAVRLGANDAPIPGFYFPSSLDVQVGDHVLVTRTKGYQLILQVLNRNALATALAVDLPEHTHASVTEGGTDLGPRILELSGLADVALDTDTNDWDPGDVSLVRVTPSAAYTVSGMAAHSQRVVFVMNASPTSEVTLLHEGSGSLGGNRFNLVNALDALIPPRGLSMFVYDDISQRWRGGPISGTSTEPRIDGGTPSSVSSDTIDGGTPSGTNSDTIDGGAP